MKSCLCVDDRREGKSVLSVRWAGCPCAAERPRSGGCDPSIRASPPGEKASLHSSRAPAGLRAKLAWKALAVSQ